MGVNQVSASFRTALPVSSCSENHTAEGASLLRSDGHFRPVFLRAMRRFVRAAATRGVARGNLENFFTKVGSLDKRVRKLGEDRSRFTSVSRLERAEHALRVSLEDGTEATHGRVFKVEVVFEGTQIEAAGREAREVFAL